jgi:hypothetical protein
VTVRALGLTLSAAFVCAACSIGPRMSTFEPAQTPGGATVTVTAGAAGTAYAGELLAVEDSTLLLVYHAGLTRIPFRLVRRIRAPYGGAGGVPTASERARLRLVARYPAGVPPELERRLLDAYHQAAVNQVSQ